MPQPRFEHLVIIDLMVAAGLLLHSSQLVDVEYAMVVAIA
jgi:hypothetical protein